MSRVDEQDIIRYIDNSFDIDQRYLFITKVTSYSPKILTTSYITKKNVDICNNIEIDDNDLYNDVFPIVENYINKLKDELYFRDLTPNEQKLILDIFHYMTNLKFKFYTDYSKYNEVPKDIRVFIVETITDEENFNDIILKWENEFYNEKLKPLEDKYNIKCLRRKNIANSRINFKFIFYYYGKDEK